MCAFKKHGELQVNCAHLAVGRFFSAALTRGCCPTTWLLSACLCACACPNGKEAIITNSYSSVVSIHIATTIISEYHYFFDVPSITFTLRKWIFCGRISHFILS